MTSSEVWDEVTARRYDEDSAGMFAPEVLVPTVDVLADLAGDGAALELAVGTGRVAVPLLERGVPVSGIELSAAMLAELRRKVDAEALPVVVGDMATAGFRASSRSSTSCSTPSRTCGRRTSRSRASPTPPATSRRAAGS